jgi:quinoprotein glucose dehydrogenase
MRIIPFLFIALLFSCKNDSYEHWTTYNGTKAGLKYSSLKQIDTSNVQQLTVAWEYHTGDVDTANHSQIQCNPIMVNNVLYVISPQLKLAALDAATGQQKWVFDPWAAGKKEKNLNNLRCRPSFVCSGCTERKVSPYFWRQWKNRPAQ